jgi:hypothetical protein
MRFHYINPLLVAIPLLFSTGNVWGCIIPGIYPVEEALQYPPADMIAFKGVITKISSQGDLDRGFPHSGFQLNLKITKIYQGANLGDTIKINYGGCNKLPGKQGSVINVLALPSKQEGWFAPSKWRNNNPRYKKWYQWW